jgi:hypothetical protein
VRSIVDALKYVPPAASNSPGRPESDVKVRDRKFPLPGSSVLKVWRDTLPWLRYDGKAMYCTLCISRHRDRKIFESNNFIAGTQNFSFYALQVHVGRHHCHDITNLTIERPIVSKFKQQEALHKAQIISILERVLLIAKKNYPISSLEDICGLGSGLGTSQWFGYFTLM